MRHALARASLALIVALHGLSAPAAASTASRVLVTDANGTPVAQAEIVALVRGRATTLGRTDAAGVALVTLDGPRTLVARIGERASAPVTSDGESIRLVLPLAEIAHLRARSATPQAPTVSAASESAVAFDDVAAARSLLPNYRSHAEGGSGNATLNGVPLQLPAGPGGRTGGHDDPGIPSDLIESFTATAADDGTVTPNYHVLSPTGARSLKLSSALGGFDSALLKLSASAVVKKFGYALVAVRGGDDGSLANRTLTDSSGLSYDHSTGARHTDASLSLSYQLGTTQINAVGIGSRRTGRDVGDTMPGAVLQGYGPDTQATADSAFGYVIAAQTHGRDSFHALDARYAGGAGEDVRAANAFASGYRYSGGYDELAFSRAFGPAALSLKATATQTTTVGYASAGGHDAATLSRAGQQTFGVRYERNDGSRGYAAGADVLHRNGPFAGTALEGNASVRTALGAYALGLTLLHQQAQTLESYGVTAYQLSPPAAASFTCDRPSATISAPAQVSGSHPHADTVTASVKRRFGGGASISAGGFASEGRDMLVSPTATLSADPGAAYLDGLQRAYGALCGGAGLTPDAIYVRRFVTVPRLRGREMYADAIVPLGALRGELTYERYSLVAPVVPVPAPGTVSTLVAGGQIGGVPLHRANALFSYRKARAVYALALQYVSANNADALPAHLTATLGAQVPLGPGIVSGSLENAFHAYDAAYASSRWAVGLPTNGAPVPTIASPLRSTWRLRYTVPLGPNSAHR
jgi:hypothetical protein